MQFGYSSVVDEWLHNPNENLKVSFHTQYIFEFPISWRFAVKQAIELVCETVRSKQIYWPRKV